MVPELDLAWEVIQEVADRENCDPGDVSELLYDTINMDALNALFHSSGGHVTFPYLDYIITVSANGDITIESSDDT